MNFGERLKELRIDANLTQEALAKKLNLSKANISKYEYGTIEPSIQTLIKIADIFKTSVDYLIIGDNSHQKCDITENQKKAHDFNCFPDSMSDEQIKFCKKMLDVALTPNTDLDKIIRVAEVLISKKPNDDKE